MQSDPSFSYVNEDTISDSLICSHVCFMPLESPMMHTCGHMFCRLCIQKLSYKCPICRNGSANAFSPVTVRVVLNMLGNIRVKCNKCHQQLNRSDTAVHKM